MYENIMLAIFDFIGSWLHIVIATILLVGYIMFIIACLYGCYNMIMFFVQGCKNVVKICKAQKFNIRNFLSEIFWMIIVPIAWFALMVFFIVILAYLIPTAIELYNEPYI